MASTIVQGLSKCGRLLRLSPYSVQRASYSAKEQYVPKSLDHPIYKVGGLYEPDYLHKLQPPTEEYKIFDIDLKGYEYPILERYQKYLFKQIRDLGLDFHDSYGHPNQIIDVEVLKPKSEVVQETYHTRIFKRTVQIADVPVYKIGLIIDVLHATAPPGVTFSIEPHTEEKEENRYVPDTDLAETKRSLEALKQK